MTLNLIVSMFVYLTLAVGATALLLFSDFRTKMLQWLDRLTRGAQVRANKLISKGSRGLSRQWAGSQQAGADFRSAMRRHRLVASAALLILALPIIAALLIRREVPLQGFADQGRDSDPIVSTLLVGEALVPPPPLPPEVFTTREVELVRPNLGGASREWALLDEEFAQRLLNVYKVMAAQGYTMALLEGYRSPARQAQLQSKGTNVTNAGAYQSYHQYGLAADTAFFRDGKLVISEKDPWAMRGYMLYGEAAEAQGLRWGGRWQMLDYGHVELKRAGVLGKK